MILTLGTTYRPATDLGYLLAKNPARMQVFDLAFGRAHVLYPEADEERCTAALILDVDPVGLVRGRRTAPPEGSPLAQYVNDRPYVASSFLSVAIARVFGSALGGRSKERPELAATPIPLVARVAALPCRGGEAFLRRLFEPLGWRVSAEGAPLDERFPDWGAAPYFTVTLEGTARLQDLLAHLYVLVPVLDGEKHYWVGDDEVDKLVAHGGAWLAAHPEKEAIAARYLKHRRSLAREAIARLLGDEAPAEDADEAPAPSLPLHARRLEAVRAALAARGARRVLDLGCGDGKLIERLLEDAAFTEIVGMDVSVRALEAAAARLRLDRLSDAQRARVKLIQGSLVYRDRRLAGYDAAAVVEVIEHLEPARLAAFERVAFAEARPRTVVVTTPNAEYNVRFPSLAAGSMRHADHRFEWGREEFAAWARRTAAAHGYAVQVTGVGPADEAAGEPSQMAVFERG